MRVRSGVLGAVLALVPLASLGGQTAVEALVLERQGRYAEAAALYRGVLARNPTDLAALMGLERAYGELGLPDSLAPFVDRAVAADPASRVLREVQLRVWAEQWGADSARAVAERWMAAQPESPAPYREWAFWLAASGDAHAARQVLDRGRLALGTVMMAADAARLLTLLGDWQAAAAEWRVAVAADPAELDAAAAALARTPLPERDAVLELVAGGPPRLARWLAADLLLAWARAGEAWIALAEALPAEPGAAAALLRRFVERTRQSASAEAARARGFALERLAQLTDGAEAARARIEAARAFADAGDLRAAERLLDRLAGSGAARPSDALAMTTLIRVLAEAGDVDEAEARFREWAPRLTPDDADLLREALAWALVTRGELDRAAGLLRAERTVGAEAVRGWIALYRGELDSAVAHFRAAGPYGRSREEATRRSQMLALVERVTAPRLPELGRGLLALARGDTLGAVGDVARAAERLPPAGGRADLLAFAGEAAAQVRAYDRAEPLLRAALAADSAGPAAPAALYTLAAVALARGERDRAAAHLERLILDYPASALVPQARRLLGRVRGMIPSS